MDCCCAENPDTLTTISDISSIITAVLGLGLAAYVFIYERRKARQDHKLQWFKELIIAPNTDDIYKFFDTINNIVDRLKSPNLNDNDKSLILVEYRSECASLRRNVLQLLGTVDIKMEEHILKSLDDFSDSLSELVFDPNINLSDSATFDNYVTIPITHVKNFFFMRVFRYQGN